MLTRSNKRMTVERRGCRCLLYASLILKQLVFIYFSSKRGVLDETFSFKNEELIKIKKNAEQFCAAVFLKLCTKISRLMGKLFWHWGSGNMATYAFHLFCIKFTVEKFS